MKKALLVFFTLFAGICSAQTETDSIGSFNSDTIPFHYPYYGPRIPPFIGVSGGVEGYQNYCWEAGVMTHLTEFYDEDGHACGPMIGCGMTYKQAFSGSLRTVELEAGIYAAFTIGVGFNENFYEGTRTFGFRPFIGTSWYHLELMAGYNCYSKNQTNIGDLNHFTIKLRYVIPVTRIFKGIPNPGNNY